MNSRTEGGRQTSDRTTTDGCNDHLAISTRMCILPLPPTSRTWRCTQKRNLPLCPFPVRTRLVGGCSQQLRNQNCITKKKTCRTQSTTTRPRKPVSTRSGRRRLFRDKRTSNSINPVFPRSTMPRLISAKVGYCRHRDSDRGEELERLERRGGSTWT